MKYLVVIDRNSAAAQSYGHLFGTVKIGEVRHMGLICTAMDASNPWYMFVKTAETSGYDKRLSLHLPHGNVLYAVEFGEDEKTPIGFS